MDIKIWGRTLGDLCSPVPIDIKIAQSCYDQWKQHFVFDAVKGKTFGQSFCDYFRIKDYIVLYVHKDINDCDWYIQQHYIG